MGNLLSTRFLTHPRQFASPVGDAVEEHSLFDVIVVGGGTAGCVMASRLSENPNVKVLLIEAGSSHDSNIFTRVPLGFTQVFKTAADWGYETVKQSSMNERQLYVPRGKILGGSSAINAMVYHHCSPEDFNRWATTVAPGWSYNDLLPYFLKSEKYTPSPKYPDIKAEVRGQSGPWLTGHAATPTALSGLAVEACEHIGIPYNPDLCGRRGSLGVTNFSATLDDRGSRSSTATAYLTADVLARPNLFIAINTMVDRVVFERKGNITRAVGVEISKTASSPRYRVAAKSEIVLCAGAIGTPQLLLLSGVGPSAELGAMDIPIVVDLPAVGKHLSDHISSGSITFPAKSGFTWDYMRSLVWGAVSMMRWLLFGTGPLSAQGAAAAAFIRMDDKKLSSVCNISDSSFKSSPSGPESPDIELYWLPSVFLNYGFTSVPASIQGFTMGAVALQPESEGTITLRSKSAWDPPLIDPNHFARESDLDVVLHGVKILLHLARTEPLKSVLNLNGRTADISSMFWPGNADPQKVTDDELKEWIRLNGTAPFHPTSSARMGLSPGNSVVNPRLQVHGAQGLRIVDASVFPTQVSGHPQAVIAAMAEKAAEMLLSDLPPSNN